VNYIKFFVAAVLFVIIIILVRDAVRMIMLIKKSAVLVANAVPFERTLTSAKHRIIVLGDSTGVGVGASDPALSTAGRMASAYPNASVTNRSKSARRIHELLETLHSETFPHADLVLIQIGANDIVYFTPLKSIDTDLDTLLRKAKTISDHVVILHSGDVGLAPIFPSYIGYFFSKRSLAVRDIYMRQAQIHGVGYVDLYRTKEKDIFLTNIDKFYANDHFHPSGAGYEDWFKQIEQAIINTYGNDDFLR